MMKKIFGTFIIFSLFAINLSFAQTYGNEWIDYDKTYYKIKVAEDGIYRVNAQTMEDAGFVLSETRGSHFKMIAYGKEYPIYVSNNELMGADDFIEFYGEKNRGQVDAELYDDPESMQLNPEYSLFNDTMVYFLTVDDTEEHARVVQVENDLSGELPEKEEYYMAEEKLVLSSKYNKPIRQTHTSFAHFDTGEGFGGSSYINHNYKIAIDHIYQSGDAPSLHIRTGANYVHHKTEISINDTIVAKRNYALFAVQQYNIPFPISKLKESNDIKIEGKYEYSPDRHTLAYMSIRYPRTFVSTNDTSFYFELKPSSTERYFEVEFTNLLEGTYFIYNISTNKRTIAQKGEDTNKLKFKMPANSQVQNLLIVHESRIINTTEIDKKIFIDKSLLNASYMVLTSKTLRSDDNGEDIPQQYADFRATETGGNYSTTVINIEDVYDEFGFGIKRHTLSIRNMGMYYANKWNDFEFVFIIGRGLSLGLIRTKLQYEENKHLFMVPTFGQTPSDNLLFSPKGDNIPIVAVGRLAATKAEHIKNYLNKAIEHAEVNQEAISFENNHWTKNILHLGGGDGASQQIQFRNNLVTMEDEIESNLFGGNVTSYHKASSLPVESSITEELIKLIDNGVSMITFLGHSAVGTWDYNLEKAEYFNNKGKYPLILSLGCHSGNIFSETTSGISEDFILTKDKGAIVYIASSYTAYPNALVNTTYEFYRQLGGELYGQPIGIVMRESLRKFKATHTKLVEEQTIHGDPAINLYPKQSPDYRPEFSSLKLEPEIINAVDKEFKFSIDISNLGRASIDSLSIKYQHFNVAGDTIYTNRLKIIAPKYKENYTFTIPLKKNNILGKNTIQFEVDATHEIDELPTPIAEDNNILKDNNGVVGYSFHIIDNNLKPIYPREFGIVNNKNITLKASSSNLFLEDQKYIIQIDTSEYFNTIIDQTEIIQGGGLVTWKPNVSYINNQVYYWRVSPDSTNAEVGYVWNNSSFIYIDNSSNGWNQSHYFQFKKDDLETMYLTESRKFDYSDDFYEFTLENFAREGEHFPGLTINGIPDFEAHYWALSPNVVVNVIDNSTGKIMKNIDNDFGSYNKWKNGSGFYYNVTTYEKRQAMIAFLENHIPENHFVLISTVLKNKTINLKVNDWANDTIQGGKSLFKTLEERGASLMNELQEYGTVPYIFLYQEGHGKIKEEIAEDMDGELKVSYSVAGKWFEGSIISKDIGPAKEWETITWNEELSETPENDTSFISVYTLDQQYNIKDTIFYQTSEKSLDISYINAINNPYIRLVYYSNDDIDKTSSQLKYWRVNFQEVPEVALDISNGEFYADSIYQGDKLRFNYEVVNLSSVPMDSLLVKYAITDSENSKITEYKRVAGVKENNKLKLDYSFDTKPLTEDFTFEVTLNPNNDQIEKYHFNNLGLKKVKLLKDEINPVLDVRFDGIHIMDDDIVSPKAQIRVQLNDNSPYMLTDNVEQFELKLRYPDETEENIDVHSSLISFFPSEDQKNNAYLEYRPELTKEGSYTLYVSAKDASGNHSGANNYQVDFQVIFAQKATQLINYPNPFSNSTQFIFTLTGAELPENFNIQIRSISGKIVKEITETEFGNLHIGLNKSDYLWDGTDDYGVKLANGVYFYKVNIKKSGGEDYEHIETSIDQFYKEGWGKLVIMR